MTLQTGIVAFPVSFTQTGGSTTLAGGGVSGSVPLTFSGGTLTGAGTITATVSNTGAIVAPGASGAGILNITGAYTQGPGGSLAIELGGVTAGTQYDQLKVTGVTTLDGTLNVSLVNSYLPASGALFQVLTFASKSGDFATKNGLDLGGGRSLTPTYGTTDLTLVTSGAPPPGPTATVSGSATICAGASTQIQAVLTGTPPWNLTWSDGTTQTNVATSPATRTVNPGATTAYTVTTVSNMDGSAPGTGSAVVTVNPRPTAVASGSATICAGATTTLSGSGGTSCSWSPTSGLSSATSCTPTASPASTTTYTLTVTDSNSCVSINAPTVTVTVNPKPATPTITAPATAAPSQTGLTASVTSNAGSTYAWGITGGSITSGATSSAVTFTAGSSGAVTLTVVETNAAGCSSTEATKVVTITGGMPTATVSGSATICAGAFTQIQAVLTGTPPWNLTWSDGVPQNNVATSPAMRTVDPVATTTYTVTTVSNVDGSAPGTGSAVITVNPKPATPTITAPSSARPNETGLVASVAVHPDSTYLWSITGGGTITAGGTTNRVTFTAGSSGTVTLSVVETSAGCPSEVATANVTVLASCVAPLAPVLSSAATSLVAGQSLAVAWTPPPNLTEGGSYVVETSRDAFASILSTLGTSATSVVLPTDVSALDSTLAVRVHGVQACGTTGASSNVVSIPVAHTPPAFALTALAAPLTVAKGGPPASASVELRNVGGVPGHLTFSFPGSFLVLDKAFADVPPGATVTVTLTTTPAATSSEGSYSGLLTATFEGGELSTPVGLAVIPSLAATGARVSASVNSVVFNAPSGRNPANQTIRLTVSPVGSTPIYLTPAVGPGGTWLSISDDLSGPVPLSGDLSLTLRVDRTKRTAQDGASPLRTLLTITPVGGDPVNDSVVLEVVDVETIDVVGGADRGTTSSVLRTALVAPPPGGTSFILPTTVKATGAGGQQVFTSDGWLRNLGATSASADLYFAPDGKNGLTDPAVKKATLSLPAGSTFRLSDLVTNVFQGSGTSGQVEVRSSSASSLSLRSTVESITGGDPTSRYGSEIPVVSYGSGVALDGGELVVPGIDDDATNRANLILAETTGASAGVIVTVNDANGQKVGELALDVPPYGKIQVNRIVDKAAPGRTLSGGWAGVTVSSGAGKVVALATVIDNRSGSFSALLGKTSNAAPPSSARTASAPQPLRYILVSLARTIGAFNTHFLTSASVVNGTAASANLTMTYEYVDQDDGNAVKSSRRSVTIPPRGALPKSIGNDILANLFGVTSRSYGSVIIEGDVARITAVASVSAQVDPEDPSQGLKTAQVTGLSLDAPEVMGVNEAERRFAGAEKSVQRRTNVILREVTGQPCRVLVRLTSTTGAKLAEMPFEVGASQYFQVNDIFGDAGVQLGDGPFQNVEVTAQVVQGAGRVVAVATVNDNISRNPEVFVFQLPGPAGPSIGF